MGKKIGIIIGLIATMVILPSAVGGIVMLFGIVNFLTLLIPIVAITLILGVLLIKKKKWWMLTYVGVLAFILTLSAGGAVDLANILYYDVKGGLAERAEVFEKIQATEGKYLIELKTKSIIRNEISSYDEKVEIGEKTFHYKKGEDAKSSIDFFINTIEKYSGKFNDYLVYDETYPLDIYFHRQIQGALGLTTSYYIKVGFYDEFRSLGSEGYRGETDYARVIIHEYVHGIMFSMLYNKDEKFKQYDDMLNVSTLEEIYNSEFHAVPMWFIEGLAEYTSYEILGLEHNPGELTEMDLREGRPANDQVSINFYSSSSRIIRELYKEVGKEGVIKIINDSKNNDFYNVFKEVTGKQLEEYYYIFKE